MINGLYFLIPTTLNMLIVSGEDLESATQLLETVWEYVAQMAVRGIQDPREFASLVMQRRQLLFDEHRSQHARSSPGVFLFL